jgi:uncharacterized tellurite resistance protein B-like protein
MSLDPQSLQALAFLYLTFGHATDGAMSGDEMRELGKKMQQWAPDAPLADLGQVIKAAVGEYVQLGSHTDKLARAREYTAALEGHLSSEQAQQIVDDLRAIATVDGDISPDEEKFIADTAAAFGL